MHPIMMTQHHFYASQIQVYLVWGEASYLVKLRGLKDVHELLHVRFWTVEVPKVWGTHCCRTK